MLNKKQIARIKVAPSSESNRLPLILRALGNPRRFKIFELLMQHRNLCVTDIARVFNITVSAASQQLGVLERANLVQTTKIGQIVCCEINRKNYAVKQLGKLVSLKGGFALNGKRSN